MLHHVWLNIPYVFILPFLLRWLVIELSEGGASDLPIDESSWSIEQAFPYINLCHCTISIEDTNNCMLFFHQPFLIFVDSWLMSWGSLEMQLKFLLDCLTAWQRVVLLCLLTICRPFWWSKKEPHWYLHESFISNGLGMSSCAHDFMRHYRQTSIDYWRLLAQECMPDVVIEGDESRHQIG